MKIIMQQDNGRCRTYEIFNNGRDYDDICLADMNNSHKHYICIHMSDGSYYKEKCDHEVTLVDIQAFANRVLLDHSLTGLTTVKQQMYLLRYVNEWVAVQYDERRKN